ncbi:MAG: hypothetical protein II943_02375 [Victivallales bacterium]|nr:hypothetical protein [Victivallales bacterium]
MAIPQKDEKIAPAPVMPAVKSQPAPQPKLPVVQKPSRPSSGGGKLGFGGVCLLVGVVALLATLGCQFFAMKAMFAI